jgi:GNAT superfamily N-acetyltransferase
VKMKIHFVQAAPDDSAYLAAMNKRLIEDEGHRNKMTEVQLESRMKLWLSNEYEAIVAMSGEKPVGYALYCKDGAGYYLRQLFIDRDCRRLGFGKALFTWLAENRFKDSSIRLDVLIGNEPGKLFWKSVGFEDYCLTMERK